MILGLCVRLGQGNLWEMEHEEDEEDVGVSLGLAVDWTAEEDRD